MIWFTEQQGRIQVSIEGVTLDNASWSDFTPGANAGNGTQDNPGGMAPGIALPGVPKRAAMTVMRPWTDAIWNLFIALDSAVGGFTTVTFVPLIGGAAYGKPVNYTGILDGVTMPATAASSGTSQKLSISVLPNQTISQH